MMPFKDFKENFLDRRILLAQGQFDWRTIYGMVHAYYLVCPEEEKDAAREFRAELEKLLDYTKEG